MCGVFELIKLHLNVSIARMLKHEIRTMALTRFACAPTVFVSPGRVTCEETLIFLAPARPSSNSFCNAPFSSWVRELYLFFSVLLSRMSWNLGFFSFLAVAAATNQRAALRKVNEVRTFNGGLVLLAGEGVPCRWSVGLVCCHISLPEVRAYVVLGPIA